MLQYDLTGTQFFDAHSRVDLPGDAEMFVLTVALLLHHDAAYTSLTGQSIVFDAEDVSGVAECIEYRLPSFADDIGRALALRQRLRDFVGLRIGCEPPVADGALASPT